MEKYSDKVMDHFLNPRNVGEIDDADGVGVVGNPTCGDVMKLSIKVEDDRIVDAKFKTFGCGAAIATSSMVTELVKGKSLEEAMRISKSTVADALDGLPKVKMHCSNLAADALQAAIDHYLCQKDGVLSQASAGRASSEARARRVGAAAKSKKPARTAKSKKPARTAARSKKPARTAAKSKKPARTAAKSKKPARVG
jgi:nitrogen fixation NifU-like protein